MANLQKTLDALQPYVIGIRYIDNGVAVVDALFKDGWILPESEIIKRAKGNDELNYYMIFSEKEGIGIDELLDYVSATIRANIEREKKHELLKDMVNELKLVFKKNSLAKLKLLKFTFGEENVMPDLNEFDLDVPVSEPPVEYTTSEAAAPEKLALANENGLGEIKEEEIIQEDGPLSDEDREILEEERRAANYFKIKEAEKLNGAVKKISSTVELPPKRKIQQAIETEEFEQNCECGPEEACSKCIENKGY